MVKTLLAGALLAVLVGSLMWMASWSHFAIARSSLSFTRVGDQVHVLVVAQSNDAATQKIRREMEQLAVNRRWFLYESQSTALIAPEHLSNFDYVLLNNLRRTELDLAERLSLENFEARGGQVREGYFSQDLTRIFDSPTN